MRISDWSSDVCSSDLWIIIIVAVIGFFVVKAVNNSNRKTEKRMISATLDVMIGQISPKLVLNAAIPLKPKLSIKGAYRSEEHTSELQSLMRTSYAVFCLKKKIILNNSRTRKTIEHHIYRKQIYQKQ